MDNEVREELFSQSPELNLDQPLAFMEAKEQGKRLHKALEGYVASSEVQKVIAYRQDKKVGLIGDCGVKQKPFKFCGRTGHGESLYQSGRRGTRLGIENVMAARQRAILNPGVTMAVQRWM